MNEDYLKYSIFKDNEKLYNRLELISENIKRIEVKNSKPFLIEFIGSCRSGKSTSIEMICDVFRKHNFLVKIIDEEFLDITNKLNKNREEKMSIDSLEYTNNLIIEKIKLFDKHSNINADIVVFDRGINDEFNWLNTFSNDKSLSSDYNDKLVDRKVDLLVIQTCDVDTSLKRKYLNSLSILPSKWTNHEVLSKYLFNLENNIHYFEDHSKKIYRIDTTNINKVDVAIDICNEIIRKISI